MGCNESKVLEDIEENHKFDIIPLSQKLNKNEKTDFSNNNNQFIMNCTNYLNNEKPIINKNSKFIDNSFPSQKFSSKFEKLLQIDNSNIVWRTAKEIFGENVKIFGETTSIKDIKLGPAENSYFLSGISSLSEFPNIVLQLFRTVSLPDDGSPIEVCMKIEGKWTIIFLDDRFMVNKENNIPIFSTSPTKNIWGMILEKAWAKSCGGYENIINGTSKEIFEAFTPFRVFEIDIKKDGNEALWKYLYSAFEYNCMMTCLTKDNITDLESIGFINNHNFSILGYQENELDKNKNNIIKLLKMRNPLNIIDISKKDLISEFGIQNIKENGIFLMDYNKFIKIFSSITVCIPISTLKNYLIQIPKERSYDFGIIRILITTETLLSISIIPPSYRIHEDMPPIENISKNLILIQIYRNKKKANYISSSYNESLFTNVKPGEYICIYNFDYKTAEINKDEIQPFNISISSTESISYFLDESDNELKLLKYVMIPKIEGLAKYKERFKEDFVVFTGNRFELTSFGFCYIKNNQRKIKYIKPSIYLRNFKSIEGELPTSLKMKKNAVFFFLFNRIKPKSAYQTGANVAFFKDEVKEADEPKIYEQIPEIYCKEIQYKDIKCDYELSS